MPKKIQIVSERWCCEQGDLVPYEDSTPRIPKTNPYWKRYGYDKMKCKHCGQLFEYYSFTDAAGSSDWMYRECK